MRIIEEGVKCEEMAVGESGFFAGIDLDGKIFALPVGTDQEENPLVAQKTGSIGVWIAGEKGLVVANITQPPFDPRYEEEVKESDARIPPKFWEIYKKLKSGRPWEEVQKLL